MSEGESGREFVLVKCPTCGARLHPRRALVGKRVRCPDCGVAVRVTETAAEPARAARRPADAGEYAMIASDDPPQPVAQRDVVLTVCGTCGARLHPRAALVGKRVRCPDCGRPVTVLPRPVEQAPRALKPAGEYRVGHEPASNPIPFTLPTTAAPDQPMHEPQPLPAEAPRLWFATGVFSFPWSPGTISRWGTLTIFALFSNGVTAYGISLMVEIAGAGGLGAFGSAMKVAFTMAAGAIIWLLMLAYTAGCVTVVIRESAAGVDDISDWSEAEVHEGIWRILNVLFPLAAAAALGYGAHFATLRLLAEYGAPSQTAAAVGIATAALAFPLLLVSALETGAFWMLVSREALRLVFGYLHGWILINLLAFIITGGWWLLTSLGMRYAVWPTIILGAPLWAAVILIDARLLGRFLYRANEVVSEKWSDADDADSDSAADDADAHDHR